MACYKIKREFISEPNEFMYGDVVKLLYNYKIKNLTNGRAYKVVDIKKKFIRVVDDDGISADFHHTMFEKDLVATRDSAINDILR